MLTIQMLEKDDIIEPNDWCRPLSLISMSGGIGDGYSFKSQYSGAPENNAKWVKVKYILGKPWHGKTVGEVDKGLGKFVKYEFIRGSIPKDKELNLKDYNVTDHSKL